MHDEFMKVAIKEANKAFEKDEVPIGCVIVKDNQIIARAYNQKEHKKNPIAHAEILAIQKACKKLGVWQLEGCSLYVTIEPCPMCSGAIIQSRIDTVIYGAKNLKGGCIDSCMQMYKIKGFNHYPTTISGILEDECSSLMTKFFKQKRLQKKKT